MFKKILIANRGEIALRIIRACREMGIATVAVHSTADADSLHVRFADEAICVGPPPAKESYLLVPAILSAADVAGADAIHPGYGFLSESADFAEVCEKCKIRFVGPRPEAIRQLGNTQKAREAMRSCGVPLLPGSEGPVKTEEEAARVADAIGYPVLLNAAGGGGGMNVVRERAAMAQALATARTEARAAFASSEVFLERYVERARHIGVQILADEYGSVVHLGERECSVQRRHQKLIEESPSPALTDQRRAEIGRIAVEASKSVGYNSTGTVEFLVDEGGDFYFQKMSTRIQTEHPVTEAVTGIDLVREQIRLAAGEPLGHTQKQIQRRGHAVECRISAEDPDTFEPCPGRITAFHAPGGPGVRVDTAAYEQYQVLSQYDPLVAKLIAHGDDREHAVRRMRSALAEFVVEGIRTNIPFLARVLASEDFAKGTYDTRLVELLQGRSGGAEMGGAPRAAEAASNARAAVDAQSRA